MTEPAPYGGLDDYIPEISQRWKQFMEFAAPVQVRAIKLRYINRILLPLGADVLDFKDCITVAPQLPEKSNLNFTGFFNQYTAIEAGTRHEARIVMMTEDSDENNLPFIFDIGVGHTEPLEVQNWAFILEEIQSLRRLKNRIFGDGLTQKCLDLFQPVS